MSIGKDNVNILDSSGFSGTNYGFTVSCWIKPHGRHNGGIWEQYDGSAGAGREGAYLLANGKIKLRYLNSDRGSDSVVVADNSDTWYHILTQHQFGSREIFANGASVHLHTYNISNDHIICHQNQIFLTLKIFCKIF